MKRIIAIGIVLVTWLVMDVMAGVPQLINYQGRLTNVSGNPVADGHYLIKFAIYNTLNGGTPLWSCDYQTVQIANGLFDVRLGEPPMPPLPNNLFSADTVRYLGIKVGIDPEIAPRTAFNSVAYAYQALRADSALKTVKADSAEFSINAAHADHSASTDTAAYARVADSAGFANLSAHSVLADTAAVLATSSTCRRLGSDLVGGTVHSGGFTQIGNTIAVGPSEVRQFVSVVFNFEYVAQNVASVCASELYYEIRIGQTGSESVKDSTLLCYFSVAASGGIVQSATFQFYYEPSVAEKTNGFNVQIFVLVERRADSMQPFLYNPTSK